MSWEDQDAALKGMLARFCLPEPRTFRDEMALRGAGATLKRDNLLCRVMLPEEWFVHQTDHFNGKLYDEQARLRGTFYYDAGSGLATARAWLTMECRYFAYREAPDIGHYVVWDRAGGAILYDPGAGDSNDPAALCERWLDSHYRMWRHPYYYWPGMIPRWKFWKWGWL